MNDNMRNRGRAGLYCIAGAYLVYLAYSMFTTRADSAGTEYLVLMIAMVAFVIIGIALVIFGIYTMKEIHEKERRDADAAEELPEKEEE